jgi:AraC-like DNA-binding protein
VAAGQGDYDLLMVGRAAALLRATIRSGRGAQEVLAGIGLSYRQLARHFVRHEGVSPKQYQVRMRVAEAQRLLQDRRKSITEVAMELGYSSSQHLCRQFKALTGKTPSEFQADDNGNG